MTIARFIKLLSLPQALELPDSAYPMRLWVRALLALGFLVFACLMRYMAPAVAGVGAVLVFVSTMGCYWSRDMLAELSLTALTREEILMLAIRPTARLAVPLALGSLLPLPVFLGSDFPLVAVMGVGCWLGCYAVALHRWLQWPQRPVLAAAVTMLECTLFVCVTFVLCFVVALLIYTSGFLSNGPDGFLLAAVLGPILLGVPLLRFAYTLRRAERVFFASLDAERG